MPSRFFCSLGAGVSGAHAPGAAWRPGALHPFSGPDTPLPALPEPRPAWHRASHPTCALASCVPRPRPPCHLRSRQVIALVRPPIAPPARRRSDAARRRDDGGPRSPRLRGSPLSGWGLARCARSPPAPDAGSREPPHYARQPSRCWQRLPPLARRPRAAAPPQASSRATSVAAGASPLRAHWSAPYRRGLLAFAGAARPTRLLAPRPVASCLAPPPTEGRWPARLALAKDTPRARKVKCALKEPQT